MTQKMTVGVNELPYWSRVASQIDLRFDGNETMRTQFEMGDELSAFIYSRDVDQVRTLQGAASTKRDTNLTTNQNTIGGVMYRIEGVSIVVDGWPYVQSDNDSAGRNGRIHTLYPPFDDDPGAGDPNVVMDTEQFRTLVSLCYHQFMDMRYVRLETDGGNRKLELGPAVLIQGGAGVNGGNIDVTNGVPIQGNYYPFKYPFDWNPSGATDSNLAVHLIAGYTLRTPTWLEADEEEGSPIGRLWTQGWIVNLHGTAISPVSAVN